MTALRLVAAVVALTLGCAPMQAQGTSADTVVAAPITGAVHEVRLVGRGGGRFEPDSLVVARGDGVKFVLASGGPHDVSFTKVPPGAERQLSANIPDRLTSLGSQLLLDEGESLVVSFAKVLPGRYEYVCLPHQSAPMKGVIIVR